SRTGIQGDWELSRRLMSRGASIAVKALFKSCRRVRDPISGFFGVRKSSLDPERVKPRGYKALVEIMVTHDLDTGETGYIFLQRNGGDSSIGPGTVKDFLLHLAGLKYRQVKKR
ncbi:MAG: hypothetical protein ABEJ66_01975, partial [Candidatus Nanohaloarchaea archaeon]